MSEKGIKVLVLKEFFSGLKFEYLSFCESYVMRKYKSQFFKYWKRVLGREVRVRVL